MPILPLGMPGCGSKTNPLLHEKAIDTVQRMQLGGMMFSAAIYLYRAVQHNFNYRSQLDHLVITLAVVCLTRFLR